MSLEELLRKNSISENLIDLINAHPYKERYEKIINELHGINSGLINDKIIQFIIKWGKVVEITPSIKLLKENSIAFTSKMAEVLTEFLNDDPHLFEKINKIFVRLYQINPEFLKQDTDQLRRFFNVAHVTRNSYAVILDLERFIKKSQEESVDLRQISIPMEFLTSCFEKNWNMYIVASILTGLHKLNPSFLEQDWLKITLPIVTAYIKGVVFGGINPISEFVNELKKNGDNLLIFLRNQGDFLNQMISPAGEDNLQLAYIAKILTILYQVDPALTNEYLLAQLLSYRVDFKCIYFLCGFIEQLKVLLDQQKTIDSLQLFTKNVEFATKFAQTNYLKLFFYLAKCMSASKIDNPLVVLLNSLTFCVQLKENEIDDVLKEFESLDTKMSKFELLESIIQLAIQSSSDYKAFQEFINKFKSYKDVQLKTKFLDEIHAVLRSVRTSTDSFSTRLEKIILSMDQRQAEMIKVNEEHQQNAKRLLDQLRKIDPETIDEKNVEDSAKKLLEQCNEIANSIPANSEYVMHYVILREWIVIKKGKIQLLVNQHKLSQFVKQLEAEVKDINPASLDENQLEQSKQLLLDKCNQISARIPEESTALKNRLSEKIKLIKLTATKIYHENNVKQLRATLAAIDANVLLTLSNTTDLSSKTEALLQQCVDLSKQIPSGAVATYYSELQNEIYAKKVELSQTDTQLRHNLNDMSELRALCDRYLDYLNNELQSNPYAEKLLVQKKEIIQKIRNAPSLQNAKQQLSDADVKTLKSHRTPTALRLLKALLGLLTLPISLPAAMIHSKVTTGSFNFFKPRSGILVEQLEHEFTLVRAH